MLVSQRVNICCLTLGSLPIQSSLSVRYASRQCTRRALTTAKVCTILTSFLSHSLGTLAVFVYRWLFLYVLQDVHTRRGFVPCAGNRSWTWRTINSRVCRLSLATEHTHTSFCIFFHSLTYTCFLCTLLVPWKFVLRHCMSNPGPHHQSVPSSACSAEAQLQNPPLHIFHHKKTRCTKNENHNSATSQLFLINKTRVFHAINKQPLAVSQQVTCIQKEDVRWLYTKRKAICLWIIERVSSPIVIEGVLLRLTQCSSIVKTGVLGTFILTATSAAEGDSQEDIDHKHQEQNSSSQPGCHLQNSATQCEYWLA